jgi:hypothetical protein
LHSRGAFGIGWPSAARGRRIYGCGCSSGVEHNLAKVGVVGSNPIARSIFNDMYGVSAQTGLFARLAADNGSAQAGGPFMQVSPG